MRPEEPCKLCGAKPEYDQEYGGRFVCCWESLKRDPVQQFKEPVSPDLTALSALDGNGGV
jgi:hypothetical protein